jgi:tRNA-specific 2-thiouridylase
LTSSKPKVLLAMSGGVDSSVAAALLLREGYEVVGCFMRLGSPGQTLDELQADDHGGPAACDRARIRIGHRGCCSINDAADARLVAARLGISFYVCNFKRDFGRIIDYFVDEYNAGRTPNPCVRCNDWLKFGRLHAYARQIDADFIASGHYARLQPATASAPPRLLRGVDHAKDQSYVLFGAAREQREAMLLPIGGYRKSEVRRLARQLDLPVFDKPDSQEICFVPDDDYAGLLRRRAGSTVRSGRILDDAGRVLGEHQGHQHFTIGQRRGIGVARGYPLYVIAKDAAANTITVGSRQKLLAVGCGAREAVWHAEPSAAWSRCTAKIRYNAEPVAARVRARGPAALEVRFDEPQFAVAPGQAVVCYDGDAVLCGGWIDRAIAE